MFDSSRRVLCWGVVFATVFGTAEGAAGQGVADGTRAGIGEAVMGRPNRSCGTGVSPVVHRRDGGATEVSGCVLTALGGGRASRSEAALLRAVALQAALDRAGFSPGVIDGSIGPKTRLALRTFQSYAGLVVTGQPDRATVAALGVEAAPAMRRLTLSRDDVQDIGPYPQDWVAKSRLKRLAYPALAALAAERGHCTQRLLARLNPGVDTGKLKLGDTLLLPDVEGDGSPMTGSGKARGGQAVLTTLIEIDLTAKTIRAIDSAGRTAALFHCSIAKDKAKRPAGACRVKEIVAEPTYLFDPAKWPEVRGVDRRLVIPPGPRNPVGVRWIGLSLEGYGIHGTPEPEMIGKTGSHGCFRLTNWDARRLARMVRVGTPVRFVDGPGQVVVGH